MFDWFRKQKTIECSEPWLFVGTVEARCTFTQEDGSELDCRNYINLYETRSGARRYEVFGDLVRFTSPAARFAEAQVAGWIDGGPTPPLAWTAEESEHRQADLIVFPGGKDGAA
jgi:hypothetical protein